jgi:FkbM family methyltransferase
MATGITLINQEIDLDTVLKKTAPRGVIHAGAYIGGCLKTYQENNVVNRCWIEADPKTFLKLRENIPTDDVAINVALCDRDEDISFNVTSNGQSSSILPLKNHLLRYPGILSVETLTIKGRKLDTLIADGQINMSLYNFLLMDLQGAECFALRGFEKNISYIDNIIAEVNYEELYEGCMLIDEFDAYLLKLGFEKIMSTCFENFGWGDAYYKRI